MNPKDQSRARRQDATQQEIKQLKHLLRESMPPIPPDQLEPRIDLWPQLRARIESEQRNDRTAGAGRASSAIHLRVPWFDWALAALAAAALLFFPGIIPALLYHF